MKKSISLTILLMTLAWPLVALAQGVLPSGSDDQVSALVQFLEDGKDLPAIGAALIVLVGLARYGLAKRWAWFNTKAGGYALAYGASLATYVGGALEQGQPITARLIISQLVATVFASGMLDHWRDMQGAKK